MNPKDEISVRLSREEWDAVLDAMTWPLPDINRPNEYVSLLSERCFAARRKILASMIAKRHSVRICGVTLSWQWAA